MAFKIQIQIQISSSSASTFYRSIAIAYTLGIVCTVRSTSYKLLPILTHSLTRLKQIQTFIFVRPPPPTPKTPPVLNVSRGIYKSIARRPRAFLL